MKNSLRVFVLLTLSCAVLTVFASADMGPKPQLTVRVEHAPEELYYLDLLAEGEYEDYTYGDGNSPYSGLDWSYSDEEAAALVGQIHQQIGAGAGLGILVGDIVAGGVVTNIAEVLLHTGDNRDFAQLRAQELG